MVEIGGVLSGSNPFHYSSSSPLTLFLFQACLILIVCNLLHLLFAKIRQPKVISEVIAGVILGPTVLGQIPNYTETVFPASSIPGLTLTANLGIILFMFFLGLEVDIHFIKRHLKTALSIGIATLAIPFGFGCLLAIPLFHNYANQGDSQRHIKFTVFMVFIAVSISVTAFPVLCRILNELRLMKDRAGVVVLGAGIINDILGWILLALSVILSNSESSPVNTVYILLCTLGWFLMYFFPLKHFIRWTMIKTHELDRTKPSPVATMAILVIMFISAYFTDIIGVHPIFGAFIAGLVVPRENNYVIKLTERMEDIPNIVFIPIYFAVAGLNVDLTLLNEGKDWGYVFASIGIAIASKIGSGTLMGRLHSLFWRESLTVGILMSCKGIVEIVVLTVGLNSGIIDKKIFGMFILMALVSTFVTTPLTQLAYSDDYRQSISTYSKDSEVSGRSDLYEMSIYSDTHSFELPLNSLQDSKKFTFSQIVNVLNTSESVAPSLELLNYLIFGKTKDRSFRPTLQSFKTPRRDSNNNVTKFNSGRLRNIKNMLSRQKSDNEISINDDEDIGCSMHNTIPLKAIHLALLTERTTDILQSSSMQSGKSTFMGKSDSVLRIFDIFSNLSKVPFTSDVIYSLMREKATNILSLDFKASDLLLLPLKGASYEYGESLIGRDIKYKTFEHFYSYILGVNELSSSFFGSLAAGLHTNLAILVSNTGPKLEIASKSRKSFILLLPNPNLTSSDYLGVYFLLMILYYNSMRCDDMNFFIFINDAIEGFSEHISEVFKDQDWYNESMIQFHTITYNCKNIRLQETFIEKVLDCCFLDLSIPLMEEATFIVPESSFTKDQYFSEEVKSVLHNGSNKKYDVLLVHRYSPDSAFALT